LLPALLLPCSSSRGPLRPLRGVLSSVAGSLSERFTS
jgi:hypothetical protein